MADGDPVKKDKWKRTEFKYDTNNSVHKENYWLHSIHANSDSAIIKMNMEKKTENFDTKRETCFDI